jgi:hypothetical protein
MNPDNIDIICFLGFWKNCQISKFHLFTKKTPKKNKNEAFIKTKKTKHPMMGRKKQSLKD